MNINEEWTKLSGKVDAMSMRERAMIFVAVAFLVYTLINLFLLEPVIQQHKKLTSEVTEQQEKLNLMQIQIDTYLQAKNAEGNSPQRERLKQIKQKIAEGEAYLKNNRERLVQPERMAEILRQVLSKNASLQLIALKTIPVSSLLEDEPVKDLEPSKGKQAIVVKPVLVKEIQLYKHGVQMTVRGNYMDLLQYLTALERLPTLMFWGNIKLEVVKYPDAELTVTLYTLSLDKIWLQV